MATSDYGATNFVYTQMMTSNVLLSSTETWTLDDEERPRSRARRAAVKVKPRITGPVNQSTPFCPELEL